MKRRKPSAGRDGGSANPRPFLPKVAGIPSAVATTDVPAVAVPVAVAGPPKVGKVKPALPAWTPWRKAIVARPAMLAHADRLNALLVAPIGVLPVKEGDPIRPLKLKIHAEIVERLRPDVDSKTGSDALRAYVHNFAYRLAVADAGSMRHDIDGNPVEPVSEGDRGDAQQTCLRIMERGKQRRLLNPDPPKAEDASSGCR